jgi:hypothetical protein
MQASADHPSGGLAGQHHCNALVALRRAYFDPVGMPLAGSVPTDPRSGDGGGGPSPIRTRPTSRDTIEFFRQFADFRIVCSLGHDLFHPSSADHPSVARARQRIEMKTSTPGAGVRVRAGRA